MVLGLSDVALTGFPTLHTDRMEEQLGLAHHRDSVRAEHFQTTMDEVVPGLDRDVHTRLLADFRLVQGAFARVNAEVRHASFPWHRGVLRMLLANQGWDLQDMPWGKFKSQSKQQAFAQRWERMCIEEPRLIPDTK